jgi:hypothetical protein
MIGPGWSGLAPPDDGAGFAFLDLIANWLRRDEWGMPLARDEAIEPVDDALLATADRYGTPFVGRWA